MKKYNKIIFIIFCLFSLNLSYSQIDSTYERPPSISVEIKYIDGEVKDPWTSKGQSFINHEGSTFDGMVAFLGVSKARLRLTGRYPKNMQILVRTIYNEDYNAAYQLAYNHFTKTVGFSFKDTIELAEVWIMALKQPNKLKKHLHLPNDEDWGGISGVSLQTKDFEHRNAQLDLFIEMIQNAYKKIMYLDLTDNNLYDFVIPKAIIEQDSFESLKEYLLQELGIELRKELRLEKIKIADFTPKP